MFCPNCGNQHSPSQKFCQNCGVGNQPKQGPVNTKTIWLVLGLLIIIGAIFIGYLVGTKEDKVQNAADEQVASISVSPSFPDDYYLQASDIPKGIIKAEIDADARREGILSNPWFVPLDKLSDMGTAEDYVQSLDSAFSEMYLAPAKNYDGYHELGTLVFKFKTEQLKQSALNNVIDDLYGDTYTSFERSLLTRDNAVVLIWSDDSNPAVQYISQQLQNRLDLEIVK